MQWMKKVLQLYKSPNQFTPCLNQSQFYFIPTRVSKSCSETDIGVKFSGILKKLYEICLYGN